MKMLKIFMMVFLIVISVFFAFSCSAKASSSSAQQSQQATVTRGTLQTDITPSGNLMMPHQMKLTFGSPGTVVQVSVQIGDLVEQGQVLAKLDTTTLEQSLWQAQVSVKQAQLNLERAQTPTSSSSGTSAPDPLDIEIKQLQVKQAELQLRDAQTKLETATMVAPFAGWIAEVNVAVGDIVSNNTAAIRILDPTQLEVDVLISEMDINQVKVGAPATVQVNAMSAMRLSATVMAISPAATSSGGVVNYLVKLNVQPPRVRSSSLVSAGQSPSPATDAQTQPTSAPPAANAQTSSATSTSPAANAQTPATSTSAAVLREGMTTTVSVITAERKDALMLPNRAIISQGGNKVVQLVNKDGAIEQRTIRTGISNWQNTEILEGLSEGDKVVVPQTSATSSQSTTSSTQQRQNQMFRPGGVIR